MLEWAYMATLLLKEMWIGGCPCHAGRHSLSLGWQETTLPVPLSTDRLVIQPQCEQHFSHIAGVGYQAKGSAADIGVWIAEIRPVESVEHLPAELEPDLFR